MSDAQDMQHLPGQPACVKWLHGTARQAYLHAGHAHHLQIFYELQSIVFAESIAAAKAPSVVTKPPGPRHGSLMLQNAAFLGPAWVY